MAKFFAIGMICTIFAQMTFVSNTLPQAEENSQLDTYLACGKCK